MFRVKSDFKLLFQGGVGVGECTPSVYEHVLSMYLKTFPEYNIYFGARGSETSKDLWCWAGCWMSYCQI